MLNGVLVGLATVLAGRAFTNDNAPILVFGTHHKTGTAAVLRLGKSIALTTRDAATFVRVPHNFSGWPRLESPIHSKSPILVIQHSHVRSPPPYDHSCFVHLKRDPVDMVVSGHLYHLRIGTDNLKRRRHRDRAGLPVREPWLHDASPVCPWIVANASLSLFDKLVRARSDWAGVLCSLEWAIGDVREMAACSSSIRTHPRAMEMDISAFGAHPQAAMERIVKFCGGSRWGVDWSAVLKGAATLPFEKLHVNLERERAERLRAYLLSRMLGAHLRAQPSLHAIHNELLSIRRALGYS